MYAILNATQEAINVKKKEAKQLQNEVNETAYKMGEKVHNINRLNNEVSRLEEELYKLEKQVLSDEEHKRKYPNLSNNGCCVVGVKSDGAND